MKQQYLGWVVLGTGLLAILFLSLFISKTVITTPLPSENNASPIQTIPTIVPDNADSLPPTNLNQNSRIVSQSQPEKVLTDNEKINLFMNLAFREGTTQETYRWHNTPVTVSVSTNWEGNNWSWYMNEGWIVECTKDIINDINAESKTVKFVFSDELSDVAILQMPTKEIESFCQYDGAQSCTPIIPNQLENNALLGNQIAVDSSLTSTDQCSRIRREFMHTLGFPKFGSTDPTSSFNVNNINRSEFSISDKMLIQMMYNTKVTSGMTPEETRKALLESVAEY